VTIDEDNNINKLHDLCQITNKAWHKWFHMVPGEPKRLARLEYLAALNTERLLYDVIMQEDKSNANS
jgi:hypothetical protein